VYDFLEPVLNFVRRQVGLRTDSASETGSLHAKLNNGVKILKLVASDVLQFSADTERTTTSDTYTKLKEIKVDWQGRIRVSFDLHSTTTLYAAVALIYINGVAVGTNRTTGSLTYVTFTEDIDVQEGDFVQLYARRGNSTVTAYVRNFRTYWSLGSDYGAVITD